MPSTPPLDVHCDPSSKQEAMFVKIKKHKIILVDLHIAIVCGEIEQKLFGVRIKNLIELFCSFYHLEYNLIAERNKNVATQNKNGI